MNQKVEDLPMNVSTTTDPARQAAITSSVSALRRVAAYTLPPELDRRILDLGERKEQLTPEERAELHAWVEFTQKRSAERLEAESALDRLAAAYPELAT
jgi:hypothetical protein